MKIVISLLLISFILNSYGQSTISPDAKLSHSANTGWINFRPSAENGVKRSDTFFSGYAYGANFGWIHFGDGAPENGQNYQNDSETDYGVNYNPQGFLSGNAYAANIGWINFNGADTNDPNTPRIDLTTGAFLGYAYSVNIGWILLETHQLTTYAVGDTDGDGILDDWETFHFGGLNTAGIGTDIDMDGQSDASEAVSGTDPNNPNSLFRIITHTYANDITDITITFTSAPERQYRLEYIDDLNNPWNESSLGTFDPDAGDTTTKTFTVNSSSRQFVRVSIVE